MGQVIFDEIADRTLVPGVYSEYDDSGAAGTSVGLPKRILIVGGRTSAGTVLAGVLTRITGDGQGTVFFGPGSMLEEMIDVARGFSTLARRAEIWAIAVNDDAGGVAAVGDIALSGTATSALPLIYLVGGRRIVVPVSVGDLAAEIATAAAALSHAHTPVTAADGTGSIDFTARNDGPQGNDIDIRVLQTPAGITTTITAMSTGATPPSFTATISAIGGSQWTHIALGYADDASADEFEDELDRRAGPMVDQWGHLFLGIRGALGAALSYGGARNSRHTTVGHLHLAPATPWAVAAWVCMADAERDDPARPRNGISGSTRGFTGAGPRGLTPTRMEDFLIAEDHQQLLDAGITPLAVDEFARISVVRMITTRQLDDNGAASDVWLDITTPRTLAATIFTWEARIKANYPAHKKDGDGGVQVAGVVTPAEIKANAAAVFDDTWVPRGWVKSSKRGEFLASIIVESHDTDVNRFNIQFDPPLINGAHVFATKFSFRL